MNAYKIKLEGWVKRTPDWCVRLVAFVTGVAPVLVVSGWFYVSGH